MHAASEIVSVGLEAARAALRIVEHVSDVTATDRLGERSDSRRAFVPG
jgi:hypothetical protein